MSVCMCIICVHADIPTYAATHCTCKRMRQAQRVPLPNADPQAFAPHRHNPGAVRFDNPTALRQQHFEARHGPCVNDSHPHQILALLAALTSIAPLPPPPPGSRQGQVRRGLAVDEAVQKVHIRVVGGSNTLRLVVRRGNGVRNVIPIGPHRRQDLGLQRRLAPASVKAVRRSGICRRIRTPLLQHHERLLCRMQGRQRVACWGRALANDERQDEPLLLLHVEVGMHEKCP